MNSRKKKNDRMNQNGVSMDESIFSVMDQSKDSCIRLPVITENSKISRHNQNSKTWISRINDYYSIDKYMNENGIED